MTTRRTLAIAAAALLCGVGDVLLVLSSEHFPDPGVWAVFGPVVGWSFVGTGLYRLAAPARVAVRLADGPGRLRVVPWAALRGGLAARVHARHRRQRPLGPGLRPAAAELPDRQAADAGASPGRGGQLRADPARARPGAAGQRRRPASSPTAAAAARAMCCSSTRTRASATPRSSWARRCRSGLCLVAVGMLVRQWRAAAAPERRSLVPLFASGGLSLALVAAYAVSQVDALLWMAFAAFAATPFAFLAGLARADLSGSRGVRTLMAELADAPERADLRDAPRACARRPGAGARVLDARAEPLRRRGRIARRAARRGRRPPHRDRDRPPRPARRRHRARPRAGRRRRSGPPARPPP